MADNDINMLDLPVKASISGVENLWIVAGGTDYRTTTAAVAALAGSIIQVLPVTEVKSGSTYAAAPTDVLIVIELSVAAPFTVVVPLSSLKSGVYWIKDGNGTASGTNPITVDASGGQLFDTLPSVPITTPFGLVMIAPRPSGGWYILNFG
jgi:hypothetical protein